MQMKPQEQKNKEIGKSSFVVAAPFQKILEVHGFVSVLATKNYKAHYIYLFVIMAKKRF